MAAGCVLTRALLRPSASGRKWAAESALLVALCALTFWIGFVTLGGLALVLLPLQLPQGMHAVFSTTRPLGVACLTATAALTAAFQTWVLAVRRPLRLRSGKFDPPEGATLELQLAVVGWTLSAAGLSARGLPAESGLGCEHVITGEALACSVLP